MRVLLKSTWFNHFRLLALCCVTFFMLQAVANGQTSTKPVGDGSVGSPYSVSSLSDLYWVTQNPFTWSKHFILLNDINAGATAGWHGGAGFPPIGNATTKFTGVFEGNGHTISYLNINKPMDDYIGLFGYVVGGSIKNLNLKYGSVKGKDSVGALVGYFFGSSTVDKCSANVSVSGHHNIGGLIGHVNVSTVTNSFASGQVLASGNNSGGLFGSVYSSPISNCYANGNVSGNLSVGGLAGAVYATNSNLSVKSTPSNVSGCYASGGVSGTGNLGGLVGFLQNSNASNCYASGAVSGGGYHGGFAGYVTGSRSSYWLPSFLGGYYQQIVEDKSTVTNCYSTGAVSNYGISSGFAGILGVNASVVNCYYDSETSGMSDNIGRGVPRSTAQMINAAYFQGWVFNSTPWAIVNGQSRPYLHWQKCVIMNGKRQDGNILSPAYVYNNYPKIAVGAKDIRQYGFLYKADGPPAVGDGKSALTIYNPSIYPKNGAVFGPATVNFLKYSSYYYARSFAVDSNGYIHYGDMIKFPAFPGEGTAESPYQIVSLDALRMLSKTPDLWNRHFKLTADIDAADTKTWNNGSGFSTIGNAAIRFTGSFDGAGHLIRNLTINRPNDNYVGFFGFVNGGKIKNLGLEGGSVTGNLHVGQVAGSIEASTSVDNCYATGTVIGNEYAGGIIGVLVKSTINNCHATGGVSGNKSAAGLLGHANASTVSNSYATGAVSCPTSAGGFLGTVALNPIVKNCFYDKETTGQSDNDGRGVPKTTAEMKAMQLYFNSHWVFNADGWSLRDGFTRPYLSWRKTILLNGKCSGGHTLSAGYLYNNNSLDSNISIREHGFIFQAETVPTISDGVKVGKSMGLPIAPKAGAVIEGVELCGLINNKVYYARTYAIDSNYKVFYGDTIRFIGVNIPVILPSLTSSKVTQITTTSINISASLSNLGRPAKVNQHGFCWWGAPNPTTRGFATYLGSSGVGDFSSEIKYLRSDTTYYFRPYATNPYATGYGEQVKVTTLKDAPSVQAGSMVFADVSSGQMTLRWNNGNGNSRLILAHLDAAVDAEPVNGEKYNASAVFGSGDQVGTENYVVYNGSGNSATVTGLIPNRTYHFRVFEFNSNHVGSPNFNKSSVAGNRNNQLTTTPALAVDTKAFNANFGEIKAGTSSSPSAYVVSGTKLLGAVTVSAPDGYEVSSKSDSGFASNVALPPSGDTLAGTKVYIRFSPNEAKDYSGNITSSSNGVASTVSVAVSGKGITLPTLTTGKPSRVNSISAECGGSVVTDGNSNAIAVGLCWSTSSNPKVNDNKLLVETVTGPKAYSGLITGLNFNTTYHVRAYASNNAGIAYGKDISFTTPTPLITVGTLGDLGKAIVGSSTKAGNYNVAGPTLVAPIVITAPAGFELSLTSPDDGFAATQTLTPVDGKVNSTIVYVRLKPSAVQAYSGVITHVSENAVSKDVAVSGSGVNKRTLKVPGDYSTVAAAMAAAINGDEILIMGTITENDIHVSKSVTIRGESASSSIIQGAKSLEEAKMRVMTIPSGISATISDLTITHGKMIDFGGGILNEGTLKLTRCRITRNSALFGGGISSTGNLSIDKCCIDGNNGGDGGGILNNSGTIRMENSTLSGNSASYGGGLYVYKGEVVLNSCTLAGNRAVEVGGGIFNESTVWGGSPGKIDIASSIIGGNTSLINPDIYGDITSKDHNLIGNTVKVSISGSPKNDIYDKDPQMVALGDHGGPVPTMPLKTASPALDAGATGLDIDCRGVARPQGSGNDIGAFESRVFKVSFVSAGHGSLSGQTTQNVLESNSCSAVTAVPDSDFHFQNWSRNGVVFSADKILTLNSVTEDMTLTANFSQDTFNVVFSVEGPGTLKGETKQSMKYGEVCSAVQAVSGEDGHFIKWTGSNGQEYLNKSLVFGPVVASVEFTAHFSSVKYVITATSGEGGTISESGKISVDGGGSVNFIIKPESGYYLKQVQVDGVFVGAVPTYTFQAVDKDHTIHAEFAKIPAESFVITATAGEGGSISPEGTVTVSPNGSAGFVIKAKPDYKISDVLVDGASVGAVSNHIFSEIKNNHSIAAKFEKVPIPVYTINASSSEGGTVAPDGESSVKRGWNVTYVFTPELGFRLKKVLVDGVSVGAVSSFEFKNINANHTIESEFVENPKALMVISSQVNGNGGHVSPMGYVPVEEGDNLTFSMFADSGWKVKDVLVNGVSVGAIDTYEFKGIDRSHVIVASFTPITHTIVASSGAQGSISPSGIVTVNEGTDQVFRFTAEAGYSLKNVLVDGASVGAADFYTFKNIKEDHKIEAEFDKLPPESFNITASAGEGGGISPEGNVRVASKGSASFAIVPKDGYDISDVLVDGASQGAVKSYAFSNVTANHIITVKFAKQETPVFTITASSGGNGQISPSGASSIKKGEKAIYSFTPNDGYRIKRIIVDGMPVGAANSHEFKNVRANHTIKVEFAVKARESYVINGEVTGSGGAISPHGAVSVEKGDNVTFTISPTNGWKVSDVLVDGVSVGVLSSYTFEKVEAAHSIKVSFAAITHTITASAGDNGSISPSGAVVVKEAGSQAFQFTANPGYYLKNVTVDDVSVGAVLGYSFQNVSKDHTILAEFAKLEAVYHKISASSGTGGSISPTGDVAVLDGKSATFAIIANEGYMIKDIIVDSASVGAIDKHTFSNVTADHSILAEFVEIPVNNHVITGSATEGGAISPEGQVLVVDGQDSVFSFKPEEGFMISDVLVDDVSVGAVSSYTFSGVSAAHRIHAVFTSKTYRIAVSVNDGGSVKPSGDVLVDSGETQLLVFTPDSGYHVEDVIIDGTSFGPLAEYEFTNVRSNHSVKVNFAKGTKNLYLIKATSSNGGAISPDGRISVRENASATFIILPEYGKQIKDVQVDGVSVGGVESYTFNDVIADHTLEAYFENAELVPAGNCLFGIKMSDPSGGWLYPKSGKYHVPVGSTLTLEVVPDENYVFTVWEILGEAEISDPNSRKSTITINGDTEVVAILEHVLPNITNTVYTSSLLGGTTTPRGKSMVKVGETQVLSAKAQNGFTFKEWLVTKGSGEIEVPESTDTHVTLFEDSGIMAIFENSNKKSTVSMTTNGYGVVNPSGELSVSQGTAMEITAEAAEGQRFLRWESIDGAMILDPNASETQAVIIGDCEITALFADEKDTVSLTIDEGDSGNARIEYFLKGETRTLTSSIPAYKAFHYWDYQPVASDKGTSRNISPIDNIYAPTATLSVYEDLTVNARFIKNEMTLEQFGKAFLIASLKNNGRGIDRIRIKRFPCDASSFNPDVDTVTVRINGNEFVFPPDVFKQLGKRLVWKGSTSSASGHPCLIIDTADQSWSFNGGKMTLSDLISANALNLSISWGDQLKSYRIVPKAIKRFCFNLKKGDKVETLKVVGDEFAGIKVSNIQLQLGMRKEKDNKLVIPKFSFSFPEDANFNSETQSMELRINNISVFVAPGSFRNHKNGWQVFHNRENHLSISLNLAKGEGKFIINYLERTGFEMKTDQFDVNLRLGDYSGALKMYPGNERTILKWGK